MHQSDPRPAPPVAPSEQEKPLHPRYVMKSVCIDTDQEEAIIEALRLHHAAATNPELKAELMAWEAIRTYVNFYRDGEFTYEQAVSIGGPEKAPAFFAAVVTIAGLYPVFDDAGEGEGAG